MTLTEERAHARAILDECHGDVRKQGTVATVEVDPVCRFGAPIGEACGRPIEAAFCIDGPANSIAVMTVCGRHAVVLDAAVRRMRAEN